MIPAEKSVNENILQHFRKGDEKFFELIFNLYYERIFSFCKSFVKEISVIENICQESFINLWINRKRIEKPSGIQAFLYTSAKCKCLNYIRDRKVREKYINDYLRIRETELDEKILASFDFDHYNFTELADLLNEAVDLLPLKCKEAFIKSRFEAKRNMEIAREMNISVKAVEAHITRALRQLRKQLSDYLPGILL